METLLPSLFIYNSFTWFKNRETSDVVLFLFKLRLNFSAFRSAIKLSGSVIPKSVVFKPVVSALQNRNKHFGSHRNELGK
jgi:hypothetical protein